MKHPSLHRHLGHALKHSAYHRASRGVDATRASTSTVPSAHGATKMAVLTSSTSIQSSFQ